jgi:hypothetical protein
MILDSKYYAYFCRKYPKCEFTASGKHDFAAVRSSSEPFVVVGVIMPISLDKRATIKFDEKAGSPWVDEETFWSEIRRKAEERQ